MAAADTSVLVAHHEIRTCIVRLARGEDRRDSKAVSSSFWPDAIVDFGIFAGSFDDYLAWVIPGSDAVLVTQHLLGQTHIELDGDTARAETHVTAYHRVDMGTEERDTLLGGRYLDRLEKRDGQWRIAERTMLYDWSRDEGVSADWSRGLMGTPLRGDHFTGKAVGDHSEAFFGAGPLATNM
ncbi:nuclear transport factor 2 family protein [Rhodococcus sp. HNM0563]|uniref:nuclear transport factor 2 family protein n=1 Tax=unclassified Rhodococcus (in: high G+C Gram-positive bacteria) TaxID=192944 RepID=UPI00146A0EFC|nr:MULTISPECIES: nuclear transport factor 2 family protein [unclassified Rhodococcus (in: high G+C Gram-positive bacteria)]MCK0092504.1 nuclear transport factor 2 family protein [Rhodococcus sp. F64268]NLU63251.1 nuclear transport factor 2 family protein [Rhodococcus sp. HNM0563]